MPRLPSAEDLGARPIPQDRSRIVTRKTGAEARAGMDVARQTGQAREQAARAKGDIGTAIAEAGDYVRRTALDIQERQDRQAYMESMTEFQDRQLTLADELAQSDLEYAEYAVKYEEELNKLRDDVTGKIKSNYLRQDFQNETDLAITKGKVRMTEIARNRAADDAVAGLSNRTQRRLDQAARAEDEATRTRILRDLTQDIETTHDDYPDHFTAESAEGFRQQATEDYARARLLSLPDEQKVEALQEANEKGNTWANFIPAEDRARALDTARGEITKKEAMLLADSYVKEGLSLEEGFERAKTIKQASLREAVESRFEKAYKLNETIKADEQAEVFNDWFLKIRQGEAVYDDVPRSHLERLTASQVESLMGADEAAVTDTFPQYSDEAVAGEAIDLLAAGDWRGAREVVMNNANKLSRSDYRKFYSASTQEPPPEIKPLLTMNQKIKNLGDTSVINKSDVPVLTKKMDDWIVDYQHRNSKEPTATEQRDMLDTMLLEYDEGLWSRSKHVFETELNPEFIQRLSNSFNRVRGRDPNDNELAQLVREAVKRQQNGER